MKAPRLAGFRLRAFTRLVENRLTAPLLTPKLLRDAGVEAFRAAKVEEPPSVRPELPTRGDRSLEGDASLDLQAVVDGAEPPPGHRFETVADVYGGAQHALTLEQMPSFALSQVKGTFPIPVQNASGFLMGEMDGFTSLAKSLGFAVSRSRDE